MQQIIPDIDPWKFRVFSPEECPAEVLEKLPFGECIHVYGMRNPYNIVYGQTKSTVPDSFAREIMDRAYAEGKNNLYPELGFASCMIKCSEALYNDDSSHTLLMYTVPIKINCRSTLWITLSCPVNSRVYDAKPGLKKSCIALCADLHN